MRPVSNTSALTLGQTPGLSQAMSAPLRSIARSGGVIARIGLIAAALGGCANMKTEPTIVGSVPTDGYKHRHPIVLQEAAETIDLPVGSQSGILSERMAHTVTLFAQEARRRGATGVTIMVPSGSANETTAYRMARQVAMAVERGGIARTAINRAPYQVEDPSADAPIRVAYARIKALVPHRCGRWPDAVATGKLSNEDDWEFGCATQTNIAAMVADPSDLVTPVGLDPADGDRRTKILTNYRAGTQTKAETGAKAQTIADSVNGGN